MSAIRRLAGRETRIDPVLDLPSIATDSRDSLVRALAAALCPAEPDWRPEYATYFTDASVLTAKLGSPAVLLYGPGDPDQAHVTDETCSVPAITEATQATLRLLATWHERSGAES